MEECIFWFPPEDKDLVGSLTSRDPLGFLALWSQRGRDIVHNLTEQTTSVAGFQLLLSALRLFEDFQIQHPNLMDPGDFFILVEQAFAYSSYHSTGEWSLPGRRRIIAFYEDDDCRLSLNRQILSNQLGYGVWGLYRGAASRSGMLDATLTRLSGDVYERMKDNPILPTRARNTLFGYILDAKNSHEKEVVFKTDGRINLVKKLSEIIENIPDKKILKQYIIPENSPEEHIARLLYEHRRSFNDVPGFRRTFVKYAMSNLPVMRDAFENIRRCEDFIAPVESVFYFLFNFAGRPLSDAARNIGIDLDKFKEVFGRFRDSGKYENGTGTRFKVYRDGIDLTSIYSFITSLLDCHLKVATGRGREPWLVIEGDKITPNIQLDPPEELNAEPGKTWIYDYYLRPLLSIYSGLLP